MYYRDATAALLVYDITNSDSFNAVKRWYNELMQNSEENLIIAIAGNKEDLVDNETITYEEAMKFADSINAMYRKTSAKNNYGIEQIFKDIILSIFPEINQKNKSRQSLVLEKNILGNKSKCC